MVCLRTNTLTWCKGNTIWYAGERKFKWKRLIADLSRIILWFLSHIARFPDRSGAGISPEYQVVKWSLLNLEHLNEHKNPNYRTKIKFTKTTYWRWLAFRAEEAYILFSTANKKWKDTYIADTLTGDATTSPFTVGRGQVVHRLDGHHV